MLDKWVADRRGGAEDVAFCDGPVWGAAFVSVEAGAGDGGGVVAALVRKGFWVGMCGCGCGRAGMQEGTDGGGEGVDEGSAGCGCGILVLCFFGGVGGEWIE